VKARVLLVATACLVLTACGTLRMPKIWPFYKKPKPAPEVVNEVALVNADGSPASYPQYWKRNALVIDLSGASGQGSVTARLPEETTWPVRVAVRVTPGSVGQLEVQAEERNVLPVTAEGTKVVDIELSASLYTPKTAAIYISWAPQVAALESAPEAPAPEFVSPTVVPTAPSEPAADEAQKANDIVTPAEAAPAQPSPPPGN
jgi:hypothetical protein